MNATGWRCAEFRGAVTIRRAAIVDRALVGIVDAGERLDQSRFAGAVLAEQSEISPARTSR